MSLFSVFKNEIKKKMSFFQRLNMVMGVGRRRHVPISYEIFLALAYFSQPDGPIFFRIVDDLL